MRPRVNLLVSISPNSLSPQANQGQITLLFKMVTGSAAGGFGLLFLILGIQLFAGAGALTASSRCTYVSTHHTALKRLQPTQTLTINPRLSPATAQFLAPASGPAPTSASASRSGASRSRRSSTACWA